MVVLWGQAGGISYEASLPGSRLRVRPHGSLRLLWRMAEQKHNRTTNQSGQEGLRAACPTRIHDVCKLVGWLPRSGRRCALSERNDGANIWFAGRTLVVDLRREEVANFQSGERLEFPSFRIAIGKLK